MCRLNRKIQEGGIRSVAKENKENMGDIYTFSRLISQNTIGQKMIT